MGDIICFCGAKWVYSRKDQRWIHRTHNVYHQVEGVRRVGDPSCRHSVLQVLTFVCGATLPSREVA